MSDGAFRTQSDIQTKDGDVNITALKDVVVHNITSTNAGISLISATKAITATGEIIGDYGVTALAKQNITTQEIQSANDVVLLNSSQGAVTVNGSITSNSDVSLGAFKDVVTQDITSQNGKVALISHNNTVKIQGAIASNDNVEVGATEDVVSQNIMSIYGTVALVSKQSDVVANGSIKSGIDVEISAQQNINTGEINSWEGRVTLISNQGAVNTKGNVTTNGANVYISSVSDVVIQNVVSNGGAISVSSSLGAVTTGYLRSDGNGTGGKVYIQAAGLVKVTGSVLIGGTNYSIYTGVNKKGWIRIVYESGALKSHKSKTNFVIGNASINGTADQISSLLSFVPPPIKPVSPWNIIPLIFYKILDAGPAGSPTHADEIDPITGNRYLSTKEYELVKQLTTEQQSEIRRLINIPSIGINFEYVEKKGRFSREEVDNDRKCYGIPLNRHLGNNKYHDQYATDVTGSKGDFIVIPPAAISGSKSAIYDGIVLSDSASGSPPKATRIQPPQKVGDLAEVKTGYEALARIVEGNPLPQNEVNGRRIPSDQERYDQLVKQVLKEALIARHCHKEYFLSFDKKDVADSARQLLNSDPRIIAEQLIITVRYITSRPLIKQPQ